MTTRQAPSDLLLSSVRLERFKAAFEPDRLELHPFTILIGKNGSGKSTLLEALQWIDTSVRFDARRACERYYGIRDLVNLRSRVSPPFFQLTVTWKHAGNEDETEIEYRVKVEQDRDGRTPIVAGEWLKWLNSDKFQWIDTKSQRKPRKGEKQKPTVRSPRILFPDTRYQIPFGEPDRLALARGLGLGRMHGQDPFPEIRDFWERAVFLRLSPNRLAQGSPAKRKSFDPLLDEEGQTLPALLRELRKDQMADLIERIRAILPDIRGIHLERPAAGRDATVSYSLVERMPYVGRAGRSTFQVPAWMLSEGTRRITAILALLAREPAPSKARPSTSRSTRASAPGNSSALFQRALDMSKVVSYALLAEGPVNATDAELKTFVELWHVYLASLDVALPVTVVPIHKPHLVAMDPSLPKMSGASEPLDHLLARVIDEHKIEAVVIAWDLTPPWDPDAEEDRYCRWNETKKLYAHLAESEVLADEWKAS
jgi:energy-coupling factor transporter ATP-binding protein EcfA2